MLTPIEIQNKEFRRSWHGLREDEVKSYLAQIVEGYEELYRENQEQREQIGRMQLALKKYQDWEETIQKTLLLAQKTMEESQRRAEQEAKTTLEQAQAEAQRLMENARKRVAHLQGLETELFERVTFHCRHWRTVFLTQAEGISMIEARANLKEDQPLADLDAALALDEVAISDPDPGEGSTPGKKD